MLCCAVLCCAVLCCVVLCCVVLCYVVLCCVVLCCAVLCYVMQYDTIAIRILYYYGSSNHEVIEVLPSPIVVFP